MDKNESEWELKKNLKKPKMYYFTVLVKSLRWENWYKNVWEWHISLEHPTSYIKNKSFHLCLSQRQDLQCRFSQGCILEYRNTCTWKSIRYAKISKLIRWKIFVYNTNWNRMYNLENPDNLRIWVYLFILK